MCELLDVHIAAAGLLESEGEVAHVIVAAGAHRGFVKQVSAPKCLIARGTSGDSNLNLSQDEYVSRPNDTSGRSGHAVLELRDGAWFVEDLGGDNRTWVVLRWNWQELASGAKVRTSPVFLFGCGLSSVLFLAGEAKPTDALVADLCRANVVERGKPSQETPTTKVVMDTETNPVPRSEQDRAMSLWAHVVKTMRAHGYEGEL